MNTLRALLVAGVTLVPLQATAQQNVIRMALVGGTVYTDPTATAIRDGVVLIENGNIAAVGPPSIRFDPSRDSDYRLLWTHDNRRVLEQPRPLHRAQMG
jgi:hypothetical protein